MIQACRARAGCFELGLNWGILVLASGRGRNSRARRVVIVMEQQYYRTGRRLGDLNLPLPSPQLRRNWSRCTTTSADSLLASPPCSRYFLKVVQMRLKTPSACGYDDRQAFHASEMRPTLRVPATLDVALRQRYDLAHTDVRRRRGRRIFRCPPK